MSQAIATTTTTDVETGATSEVITVTTKPGYRTTEFWLSAAAALLGTLFASGALTNNTALAIAGVAASILTSMGYSVSRGMAKATK
jgi:hypothetical protein